MAYTLKQAEKLAREIFNRSFDYSQVPYMDHLVAVSGALEMFDEELQVVGMLHSILERTDWTATMLLDEGLPQKSVDTIVALTRDRLKQTNAMYFRQVRQDEDATLVKIACSAHNCRDERLGPHCTFRHMSERLEYQGFSQRHLWTAAYEDDLRDILTVIHPELLVRADDLKKDGKL